MQAPPGGLNLRLLPRYEVEAHSRCVLVSGTSTSTRHVHERVLAFVTEPPCKLHLVD